ncbi:t-SNARE domain followed by hydrophobic stretch [Cryptosporidium canis]|uniref:t-SNARE domain followed by hydrophobic stretch n=1 Tax=Cryptosporidium canis TaxID=195482 RepID=A0A9D5DHQ1_9CRYT|nr:t-SNARE domain followed by hydrophobic stretch [Cryptosporidium canis]
MVFEIQIHDDDGESEEEESLSYFISGTNSDWTDSHEKRIAKLFQQLEDRLAQLEGRVSETQRLSRVDQEVCQRASRDLERIEKISQSINDALRSWRIDLAGNPIEYKQSRDTLENYIARQRASLDRIGLLSRRVGDLLSRQAADPRGLRNSNHTYSHLEDYPEGDFVGHSRRLPDQDSSYELQLEDNAFRQQPAPYRSTITSSQQTFDMVDRQIAQETAIGLGHIQSQMYEANQIFKNLASMVNEQGETIQNLETTIDNTVYTAKQAVGELRKAYNSSNYKFSLLANYGLPGFLLLILALILVLYFLHII